MSRRLKSLAIRYLAQKRINDNIKWNIKTVPYCSKWGNPPVTHCFLPQKASDAEKFHGIPHHGHWNTRWSSISSTQKYKFMNNNGIHVLMLSFCWGPLTVSPRRLPISLILPRRREIKCFLKAPRSFRSTLLNLFNFCWKRYPHSEYTERPDVLPARLAYLWPCTYSLLQCCITGISSKYHRVHRAQNLPLPRPPNRRLSFSSHKIRTSANVYG